MMIPMVEEVGIVEEDIWMADIVHVVGRNTYRGDDKLEEMLEEYLCYSDAKSEYDNTGNYGAKDDTKDSLKHMLKSAEDFFEMLMNEAGSQEEIQMIKETARKISEM